MTFDEYLNEAIDQLQLIQEANEEHYKSCTEICTICSLNVTIPGQIAVIKAAITSPEPGLCDDPACVNNIAYEIAKSIFDELSRKMNNNVETS